MKNLPFCFIGWAFFFLPGAYAQSHLDVQAHRGGRGLLPENSIPAMLNAVSLGARTLELDCVISADGKVVVSHDPWMNPGIMLLPDGGAIPAGQEQRFSIYTMTYDSVRRFILGRQPYKAFPGQRRLDTYKPLLSDLIDSVESYVRTHHLKPVYYNIETKTDPSGDDKFHPKPEPFVQLMMGVISSKDIASRVTIQSFDPRTLQIVHAKWPGYTTALLVENKDGFETNVSRLGFVPTIYSPDYKLVDAALVKAAHVKGVQVLPWTVNEIADMKAIASLGVDGIISDYPDRLIGLFGNYQTGSGSVSASGAGLDGSASGTGGNAMGKGSWDVYAAAGAGGTVGTGGAARAGGMAKEDLDMAGWVTRYTQDVDDLEKVYIFKNSPEYFKRMRGYNKAMLDRLGGIDFSQLDISGQVDYLLLTRNIRHALLELDQAEKLYDQVKFAVPFAQRIMDIQVSRRRGQKADAMGIAHAFDSVRIGVAAARSLIGKQQPVLARASFQRIVEIVESLREGLKDIHTFYNGYDPSYTWWMKKPYQSADSSLDGYLQFLRGKMTVENLAAVNPIGEDKLKELLQFEMVAYGPKDLVDIANKQFAWCEAEMKKAAAALGCGDDWKAALEKVKLNHVEAGKQPELVNNLAEQAIQYVESHDLVTIPPLAKEAWRMFMLTPEEQKFAPFFLGGPSILIGYPTDDMDEPTKVGSMRSNNYAFSHATVFHELIPGHNLQGFMNQRYKPYREAFNTPFSVEGWALYWEMLLWDKGFHATPEEKVGALFWRMHRCARIIFSLNYHLGKWTPQQCVDFLVEKVGHERFSAESEVRRSFSGSYGPLYQIAYMLGGLQMRALHHEWVDSGKMTDKAFHDAFLREGTIPIELFRATIAGQPLRPDFTAQWKFADALQ